MRYGRELVTEEKSDEISAVPELLESLSIENSIITADAMSCQKEIVKKIQEGKADYVIGLKGNQPILRENAALYFEHYVQELPCKTTRPCLKNKYCTNNRCLVS